MRIEEIAAAEPMTEENEQELARLARRYVAVARLLRQRDELRARLDFAEKVERDLAEMADARGRELERLAAKAHAVQAMLPRLNAHLTGALAAELRAELAAHVYVLPPKSMTEADVTRGQEIAAELLRRLNAEGGE